LGKEFAKALVNLNKKDNKAIEIQHN